MKRRHNNSTDDLAEDDQKEMESRSEDTQLVSLRSKWKFLPERTDDCTKQLARYLSELREVPETSLILQALKLSDSVTICLDLYSTNLIGIAGKDALGWYKYSEGEILIGAKEMSKNKSKFLGVLAHELAHCCMQTVFKNNCLPYFRSDPNHVRKQEFESVVQNVQKENMKNDMDETIKSVFRVYSPRVWDQELIVRVPQLIAIYGVKQAAKILSRHQSTKDLLDYYKHYVMEEIQKFLDDEDLEKSRVTTANLNTKLGLLPMYVKRDLQFTTSLLINLKEENSIWVYSSAHPYLTFMKIALALNSREPTDKFYENNLFCDLDAFFANIVKVKEVYENVDECRTLFVVCADVKELGAKTKFETLIEYLKQVLTEKTRKKVILSIGNEISRLTEDLLKELPNINFKFNSIKKIEFSDLVEESQKLVLQEEVTLKKRKVKLGEIVGDDTDVANGELIERLINGETEIIQGKMTPNDFPPGFVMLGELLGVQQLVKLIYECTNDVEGQSFKFALIIVGDLEHYVDQLEHVIPFDTNITDELHSAYDLEEAISRSDKRILLFSALNESEYPHVVFTFETSHSFDVCYFVNMTRHRVDVSYMYDKRLVFERKLIYCPEIITAERRDRYDRSHADFYTRLQFRLQKCTSNEDLETSILRMMFRGKVTIISDTVGSGKSQFLNQIYNMEIQTLVFKISMESIARFIELVEDIDTEKAVDLLLEMGEINNQLSKYIFKSKISSHSSFPVTLLLDGLNTKSTNMEKLVNFLNCLRFENICLVITTRPQCEQELLSAFSTLNYCSLCKFEDLTVVESEGYLTNSCISRSKLLSRSDITVELMRALIAIYDLKDSRNNPGVFLRNPLNVSILSEILLEDIKDGNAIKTREQLYNRFLRIKFRTFLSNEKGIDEGDPLFTTMSDRWDYVYGMLGVFSVNDHEARKVFLKDHKDDIIFKITCGRLELDTKEVEKYLGVGVISSVSMLHVEFVHQAFAKHFFFLFFNRWVQKLSNVEKFMTNILQPEYLHEHTTLINTCLPLMPDESDENMKYIFKNIDFDKLMDAVKYYISNGYINLIEYIFKCWKQVRNIRVIVYSDTHSEDLNHPLVFAAQDFKSDRILEFILKEAIDEYGFGLFEKTDLLANEKIRLKFVKVAPTIRNTDIVKLLKSKNYDIISDATMFSAVAHGELEVAKWLNNKGINMLHVRSSDGRTLIHEALTKKQYDVVRWLVEEGVDANEADFDGRTPLYDAIMIGDRDMIQFICDVQESNTFQSSASLGGEPIDAELFQTHFKEWETHFIDNGFFNEDCANSIIHD